MKPYSAFRPDPAASSARGQQGDEYGPHDEERGVQNEEHAPSFPAELRR
jgi:hypothetical protein